MISIENGYIFPLYISIHFNVWLLSEFDLIKYDYMFFVVFYFPKMFSFFVYVNDLTLPGGARCDNCACARRTPVICVVDKCEQQELLRFCPGCSLPTRLGRNVI